MATNRRWECGIYKHVVRACANLLRFLFYVCSPDLSNIIVNIIRTCLRLEIRSRYDVLITVVIVTPFEVDWSEAVFDSLYFEITIKASFYFVNVLSIWLRVVFNSTFLSRCGYRWYIKVSVAYNVPENNQQLPNIYFSFLTGNQASP